MKRLITLLVLTAGLVTAGLAQTAMTNTTLSSAVGLNDTTIKVGSATGFTANTTMAVVDAEALLVTAVNGTQISVIRGQAGTKAVAHASGVILYVGTFSQFFSTEVVGACTAANEPVLPHIVLPTGNVYGCPNGQWVRYTPGFGGSSLVGSIDGKSRYCSVPVGSVAYGSFGTNTTTVAGTSFFVELHMPVAKTLTGVAVLNGATVGTDKWIVSLYGANGGAALASSTTAGTLSVGANAFQDISFASTYVAYPGRYWIGVQTQSTTDTLRTVAASTFPDVLASSATGTFGTVPSLTVPTTFTADKGPIACVF